MAIYHFSAQMISRSKGQSSVASASYRSGERLKDERTGETKYYRREVQPETMILSPSHSPQWVNDRQRLWNEVEKAETRKNSQLAREINVALPKELSHDQQRELIQDYVQTEFVNKGMIADIAIHRDDKENPHAHVMLTTREISEEGFTVKNRDWNDRELLNHWREQWAKNINKALEREGIQEHVSHLSHEARGVEQLPTVHLGHVAHAMEKRGVKTDRGNINRERQEYNRLVVDLQKYREEKEALQKQMVKEKKQKDYLTPSEKVDIKKAIPFVKGFVTLDKIQERREQIDQWEEKISKSKSYLEWKSSAFEKATSHYKRQEHLETEIQKNQDKIKQINWFNPLKIKDNRLTKERCEKNIERLQQDHEFHDKKLDYYRDKLKFHNKEEFFAKYQEFAAEKELKTSSFRKQNQEIREQRTILDQAEKALKQGEIREITSHYPELKTAGTYMSYENAMKLKELNQKAGKIVPIEEVKTMFTKRSATVKEYKDAIREVDHAIKNARTAEVYFKELNDIEKRIQKTENNPLLKAKLMISKEAKKEHMQDLQKSEEYKAAIEKLGYKDQKHLTEHLEKLEKSDVLREKVEHTIEVNTIGNFKGGHGASLGLLEAILQGVQEAQQQEVREHNKREKQRLKRKKTRGFDLER